MVNTGDVHRLAPLLDPQFSYESQMVLSSLDRDGYIDYMRQKLVVFRESGAPVFAEMGRITAYGGDRPCVIIAQPTPDTPIGLFFAQVDDGRLLRLDMCLVPHASLAVRSGDYPS